MGAGDKIGVDPTAELKHSVGVFGGHLRLDLTALEEGFLQGPGGYNALFDHPLQDKPVDAVPVPFSKGLVVLKAAHQSGRDVCFQNCLQLLFGKLFQPNAINCQGLRLHLIFQRDQTKRFGDDIVEQGGEGQNPHQRGRLEDECPDASLALAAGHQLAVLLFGWHPCRSSRSGLQMLAHSYTSRKRRTMRWLMTFSVSVITKSSRPMAKMLL